MEDNLQSMTKEDLINLVLLQTCELAYLQATVDFLVPELEFIKDELETCRECNEVLTLEFWTEND